MTFDANIIGKNIKKYRKGKMTQVELAEKVGISIASIQGYEQGKFSPRRTMARKISDALGVQLNQLYEEEISIKTNADRIRNMTDEELAELLCLYDACVTCSHDGRTCNTMNCDEIGLTKKWLQSEVE